MKIYTPVKTNFIYPEILPEHYRFGSGQILGTPLREDGDWRDYLPPEEAQNIRGIESSACYIEAQQHAIATIEAILSKARIQSGTTGLSKILQCPSQTRFNRGTTFTLGKE